MSIESSYEFTMTSFDSISWIGQNVTAPFLVSLYLSLLLIGFEIRILEMKEVTDVQLFVIFLVLNSILWFYCYYFRSKSPSRNDKINAWTEYYLLHDVFDVILCVTAILSLLQRIEEYYVLSFACAYFVVDFFDCIIRKSWMFL